MCSTSSQHIFAANHLKLDSEQRAGKLAAVTSFDSEQLTSHISMMAAMAGPRFWAFQGEVGGGRAIPCGWVGGGVGGMPISDITFEYITRKCC